MKIRNLSLILILILAFALRLYKLNDIPVGLHQDELSQAYNGFSILNTGRDRYGEAFPILFRSFGSYQPPVYTYFLPLSILIFGNTIFAARFVSAVFGIFTVLLTYFIVSHLSKGKYKYLLSLFSALMLAISPWAIHFSRRVVEANLGLFFFLLAFYFFVKSLKNIRLFPLAALIMGISTHAYYSERVIAVLFIPIFLFFFRDYFLKYKRVVVWGICIFGLTLILHAVPMAYGAFASRFDQVSYFGNEVTGLNRWVFIAREFFNHYVNYYSPKALFSDLGSELARTSPGLGTFYGWVFVPFLVGLYNLAKILTKDKLKAFIVLGAVSLVPAALTGDLFYPLRVFEYLWFISIISSVGLVSMFEVIKSKPLKYLVIIGVVLVSVAQFSVSYFVLFKYETTENVGKSYEILLTELEKYKGYKVIFDATRDPGAGLKLAYFKRYDPRKIQQQLRPQIGGEYYSRKVDIYERYIIDNVETRPIAWGPDRCLDKAILIGDNLAISEEQIEQHNLKKVFEIQSVNKNFTLTGFATNPDKQCL